MRLSGLQKCTSVCGNVPEGHSVYRAIASLQIRCPPRTFQGTNGLNSSGKRISKYFRLVNVEILLQYKSNQFRLENILFPEQLDSLLCQLKDSASPILARGSLRWVEVPDRSQRAGST